MTEYDPAEALAEIERTQQKTRAEQRLPLWYAPAYVALLTFGQIGMDSENIAVNLVCSGVAIIGFLTLIWLEFRLSRVRWAVSTSDVPAMAVYTAWALLGVATAIGVHTLADGLDEPWRKVLAGGVTMVLMAATTRPTERLVLHRAKGRVTK
ncbi:hypothetical protein ABGB12_02650 [Actinocorallia sp. B10E7]|uniref:hypothetical protein n=1 Tax=Actinocorallia sp. B10E7 TaxID=3153558 RepID=UPI00325C6D13